MDESFLCHSRLELTDDLENLDTHSSDNPGRILPAESPERPTQLASRPLPLPLRSSTVYTVLSPDSGPLEVTSPFQSVEHSLGAVARLYCPACLRFTPSRLAAQNQFQGFFSWCRSLLRSIPCGWTPQQVQQLVYSCVRCGQVTGKLKC